MLNPNFTIKVVLIFCFSSILLLGFTSSICTKEKYKCKRGNYTYAPATYQDEIFMKEQYRSLFDSLLNENIYTCFCEKKLGNFPPKRSGGFLHTQLIGGVSIEPFFINLKNHEGLYGKRIWKRKGPSLRFQCGYMHYLFIVADNTYYSLTDDSLTNVTLVREKLSNSFTPDEINRIIKWGLKRSWICSSYTFYWPALIKEDSLVHWDVDIEAKRLSDKK